MIDKQKPHVAEEIVKRFLFKTNERHQFSITTLSEEIQKIFSNWRNDEMGCCSLFQKRSHLQKSQHKFRADGSNLFDVFLKFRENYNARSFPMVRVV